MTSEVVIDVRAKEISIALLEDKKLVKYQNEPRSASFSVGNIYIAKVKKLMPGLNACFVDVGIPVTKTYIEAVLERFKENQ